MVFSSASFLFLFLPAVLILVYPLPRKFQNYALLAFSIAFYLWGAGAHIWVIAAVSMMSWVLGWMVSRFKQSSKLQYFAPMIILIALPLLIFKYVPVIGSAFDNSSSPAQLYLPLGISFFTFHAISYVIDIRRGEIEHSKNLSHYLLYLFLFPHQIAGPIVRFSEIVDEIKARKRPTTPDIVYGISRFSWGLAKKTCIADNAGSVATAVWTNTGAVDTRSAWIGALAYAVQIYFDFSAYSDMALGLARIFNFHFPENFASPYRSRSATEFWKRWHMTLSRWFRDYVYIPMGGNRHGKAREIAALLTTFGLTSLWHGATLPYLIWGGMWSGLLIIERFTGLRKAVRFSALRRTWMIFFIIFSWVPFRSLDTDSMMHMWRAMVVWTDESMNPDVVAALTPISIMAIAVGFLGFLIPQGMGSRLHDYIVLRADGAPRLHIALTLGFACLLTGVILSLWSSFSPFLYYQF
ncbi:MAG: hypothetical protein RLZZ426_821 [Actinomycetota bacterium]